MSRNLRVTLINSLLRINQVGAPKSKKGAPRIFPAFHARKMVVHPCTTKEGLNNQTFLRGMRAGILVLVLGWFSPLVEARETEHFFDVAQATESPLGKSRLLDVPFYMKGQEAPVAVKLLSTWTQERASSGVLRTDKKTCDVAFLSALIALQESAKKDGGDAIINIVSSTKGKTTESSSQYRCVAGTTIAHVALTGDVIKTQ